jgi:predicted ABC-type transport system involved in lysophospholipase L1 biosynthesis ATPase subunit
MVIDARDVTLTLGETAILRGIDLSVGRGESVALLGTSGSGKSSLMAVLAGLERASSTSADSTRMRWRARGVAGSGSCSRPSTCCRR